MNKKIDVKRISIKVNFASTRAKKEYGDLVSYYIKGTSNDIAGYCSSKGKVRILKDEKKSRESMYYLSIEDDNEWGIDDQEFEALVTEIAEDWIPNELIGGIRNYFKLNKDPLTVSIKGEIL